MTRRLELAMTPDDPSYCGRVVSYSTEQNDILGITYILVLETLIPWCGLQIGDRVKFKAPSETFWKTAIEQVMVSIERYVPEGAKIAHYKVGRVGTLTPTIPKESVQMAQILKGKELAMFVAGAYDVAAKTITWYNKLYPELKIDGTGVSTLAHTLMISHARGEVYIAPYKG